MSNTTVHASQGDSKHGGALFLLPREIRDMIYRLVVKGRYQVDKPSTRYRYFDSESDVGFNAGPDLSILRASKVVSREAEEILYSESFFRFFINSHERWDDSVQEQFCRLKRVAPMMKNVGLDIDGTSIEVPDFSKTRSYVPNYGFAKLHLDQHLQATIGLFGGLDIKRQTLHVRFLNCSLGLLGTSFSNVCNRLKMLIGFRFATVEVIGALCLRFTPRFYGLDRKTEEHRQFRDSVGHITNAVTEQLEPAFGPAIFSFKSYADDVSVLKGNGFYLGDPRWVGFLEFYPGKHSV